MSQLIDIAGRAWISADHVKFVTWRATVNPFTDPVTGKTMRASVTIETYHDSYRLPFETPADAQAAAERVVLAAVLGSSGVGSSGGEGRKAQLRLAQSASSLGPALVGDQTS